MDLGENDCALHGHLVGLTDISPTVARREDMNERGKMERPPVGVLRRAVST